MQRIEEFVNDWSPKERYPGISNERRDCAKRIILRESVGILGERISWNWFDLVVAFGIIDNGLDRMNVIKRRVEKLHCSSRPSMCGPNFRGSTKHAGIARIFNAHQADHLPITDTVNTEHSRRSFWRGHKIAEPEHARRVAEHHVNFLRRRNAFQYFIENLS